MYHPKKGGIIDKKGSLNALKLKRYQPTKVKVNNNKVVKTGLNPSETDSPAAITR